MKKEQIYLLLEEKMLEYPDYRDIPIRGVEEPFVAIGHGPTLTSRQDDSDMLPFTNDVVYVRETVFNKLKQAGDILATKYPDMQLEVVYGYRALEVQRAHFEYHKKRLAPRYNNEEDLIMATQRLVAVPEVGGHPAGAAVDIQILQDGKPLDFGTKIKKFVSDAYTFSPFISEEGWKNRQLLRRTLMAVGFAPFDGEWWHFSYGDREWAKYYDEPAALYEQVLFSDLRTT